MSIIMPEVLLYNTLKSILALVKTDYAADPTHSLLYYAFKKDEFNRDIVMETLNYFDQAKSVFVDKRIAVYLGYNMQVANQTSIHILLPGEASRPLTIGADEGYQPPVVGADGANSATFTSMFDATYQIMITSENSSEVLIVYHLLKTVLLALYEHLELAGLRDLKFGGQDVNIQSDLVPPNIFHKALSLSFMYENTIPTYFRNKIITGIKLLPGTILEE